MPLFKKKDPEPDPTQANPTDQVIQLRQQGLNDNQIIQALQKDGFASAQIFDAMSQADIKGGVETATGTPPPATPEAAPAAPGTPPAPGAPAQFAAPAAMPEMAPPPAEEYAVEDNTERIEEIAEAIIDEKWEVLVKDIHKIVEWKDETNSKMSKIESEVSDLREDFDKLHKAIISKIDDYDKNLSDVGSEIKAMNQVFQKVLPTFTENISTLSRITKKLSSKETN